MSKKSEERKLRDFILSLPRTRISGKVEESEITAAEEKLNLKFSEEYKELMKDTGAVLVCEHEIYGPSGAAEFTLSARQFEGIHPQMYVFECLGVDDVMMLQNEEGYVFECCGSRVNLVADSILTYLQAETGQQARTVITTIRELKQIDDLPGYYYSIGGYAEEAVCMESNSIGWIVYTGERGIKHDIKFFSKEADACNYFVAKIKRLAR